VSQAPCQRRFSFEIRYLNGRALAMTPGRNCLAGKNCRAGAATAAQDDEPSTGLKASASPFMQ
jgi:hypothetical protein